MPVEYINGNLLEIETDIICHQINSLSVKPHGLSATIAKKLPWANRYGMRRQDGTRNLAIPEDQDPPGIAVIIQPPSGVRGPTVAALVGQYEMGKPGAYNRNQPLSAQDTKEQREQWFRQALRSLGAFVYAHKTYRVAFPYMIGCGLAGGSWDVYEKMITEYFSEQVPLAQIKIVKLP